MNKTGAELAVFALEQIGVKKTFGIPGVHNTEFYDELNKSEKIEPMLVTHEGSGAFMADAVSRTSDSIGCLAIVPAAGTTNAMSGMGEAYLDGIPMLVITGGIHRASGKDYQLHQIDQGELVAGVTKGFYLIESYEDIIPTIYEAYTLAISGEPGPVFIELPINLQLFRGEVEDMPNYQAKQDTPAFTHEQIKAIVDKLVAAEKPVLYVGWGAVDAFEYTVKIAEKLIAPVSTTLQGKSSFPNNHPYCVGVGFGKSGKPAAQNAFKHHDVMLAVGVRFSELATGSFGIEDPKGLIHVDINNDVFNKNYQAETTLHGDATEVLKAIYDELETRNYTSPKIAADVAKSIKIDHDEYYAEWLGDKKDDLVSPGYFFKALNEKLNEDAIMVVDDGKHTFLAAELFEANKPRHFISPTDFNCMGYCVPASIGTKLSNPDKQVVGIVGDGAFLMTGLELVTATTYELAPMIFVFHDGELGQISQFQKVPLNRKTCTTLGNFNFEGVAIATGAHFVAIDSDNDIEAGIDEAIKMTAEGKPVLIDVKIDYSKKTMLTKGVLKTNLSRFPIGEKVRFIGRAIKRHVFG